MEVATIFPFIFLPLKDLIIMLLCLQHLKSREEEEASGKEKQIGREEGSDWDLYKVFLFLFDD